DVRVQQPNDLQRFEFTVDRTKAMELGLSERDVAGSVLLSLSGSSQVTPTYWLDYTTGVQYLVNVRVPERQTTTLSELRSMPLSASKPGTGNGQVLENVTDVTRITSQPIYTHYNVIPRSEEHTSELQSLAYLVCRLLLEKKKHREIYLLNESCGD